MPRLLFSFLQHLYHSLTMATTQVASFSTSFGLYLGKNNSPKRRRSIMYQPSHVFRPDPFVVGACWCRVLRRSTNWIDEPELTLLREAPTDGIYAYCVTHSARTFLLISAASPSVRRVKELTVTRITLSLRRNRSQQPSQHTQVHKYQK